MRGIKTLWAGILAGSLLAACGAVPEETEESVGTRAEAITLAQSAVLGFEAPTTDWRTSAGTLSSSTTHSQGSFSLGIRPNGWTELTSVTLSSLGNVNNTLKLDIRMPSVPVWGELRAIILVPSKGIYWSELGSKDLHALPAGSFQTVSFPIPASLEAILDGSYNDLMIKLVVNAQTLSTPYLLDNIVLAAPGGGGGTGGAGGTGGTGGSGGGAGTGGSAGTGGTGPGPTRQFTILRPSGVTLDNTFMSATDHLSFFSQATIGVDGKTPALASFGSATQTYLQSQARAFGNVYSVPNVQLDARSLVGGFIRTRGTIGKQGTGIDAPVVRGGEFPGQTITPVAMSWSVTEPTTNSGNVEYFTVPTVTDHVVPPGSYAKLNIQDRNRIFLSTGTYFFTSFNTEPLSEIWLNKTNGPIIIYVRDSFVSKGKLVENGGPVARLLVGYSGTPNAFVQSAFDGTLVAPNATIQLERPTQSGSHLGSFYGKAIEVASGVHTVRHQPFNFDFLCPRGDSDGDGTSDCTDICSKDPSKVTSGICGCGHSDVDTDLDGASDCVDECPLDASTQIKGTCGCPSDSYHAPNGTVCSDSPCRGAQVCNNGVCGDASSCKPDPSCKLRFLKESGHYYWLCSNQVSWDQARTICGAVDGSKLVQIDSDVENAFVAKNLAGSPSWTGANDRTTDGEWFWNGFTDDTGDQFWSGGATGKRYFARYSAWGGGAPPNGTASCARVESATTWSAAACNTLAGYVCELSLDRTTDIPWPGITPSCELLGINCDPDPVSPDCVSEAEAFGGLDEGAVLDAFSVCQKQCQDINSPACLSSCSGPAAPPPAGSVCNDADDFPQDSLMTSCGVNTIAPGNIACDSSADCPANLQSLCSREYPGGGPTAPRLCVIPVQGCDAPPPFPDPCVSVDLCEEGTTNTVVSLTDGGGDLSETPFDPLAEFGPGAVAPADPYPADDNPCGGSCVGKGHSHPWCTLTMPDHPPARDPVAPNKGGDTGGSAVSFVFQPKFELTHSADIGAFGLPKLDVTAAAGVFAEVQVHAIPGVPDIHLLDVLFELDANQCGIYNSEQRADIMGADFIALAGVKADFPVKFPSEPAQATCTKAYADFENAGNRAKKALRDTLELLKQYKNGVKDDVVGQASTFTNNLKADICRDLVGATPPRGFPAGNCPSTGTTESPEATINRFTEYYRRSLLGFGQTGIKGLTEVAADLEAAAQAASIEQTFPLIAYDKTEVIPIVSAQFFIGPIPVFLDVEATATYGAHVDAKVGLNAGPVVNAILHSEGDLPAQQVAYAGVEGRPYAGAGLGLFAGVGFGVPGFKVKIGMAADLTLGTVYLPAYAGAGVGLGAEVDSRPVPVDIGELSTGVNLIPAKRFVADLRFKAGLGVKVRDVLHGSISGKLKISVLFFSKSWRKVLFNFTGICAGPVDDKITGCDFDLITYEGSTNASTGSFPWAQLRMPTPFPQLVPLAVGAATPGTVPVNKQVVEKFFYDSECDCINGDDTTETRVCLRNDDCCPNTPKCFSDPVTNNNRCILCLHKGQACRVDSDCCGDAGQVQCNGVTHTCQGLIAPCGAGCSENDECSGDWACFVPPGQTSGDCDGIHCEGPH